MSQPNGKPLALQRARNKAGAHIGSYFIWVRDETTLKYRRVNLATKNFEKAKARRSEAMSGRRDFVYDDDEKSLDTPTAPEPAPVIPVVPIPTARQLEPMESSPVVLPPEPAPLEQPASIPDPPPFDASSDDWTKDAARAAGAPDVVSQAASPSAPENKDAPAPAAQPVDDGNVRIKDLAQLGPIFITASRIAVQLQIAFHVLVARYLFKIELDPIRDDVPKDIAGFMAAQGRPWAEGDPREGGRQLWERCARRLCPDNLVLPDFVLAPIVVGIGTLPTQIANAKPINKAKPHVPVIASQTSTPAPPRPPEPAPPKPPETEAAPETARTRHIPVMSPDAMS